MMLVIRYFAKAGLTASKMKLLWIVLVIVLISVGFKMSKQDPTASHTRRPQHQAGTTCCFFLSPACWNAGLWDVLPCAGMALDSVATLGNSSALLGLLCQGRELCRVVFLHQQYLLHSKGQHGSVAPPLKDATHPCLGVSAAASLKTCRKGPATGCLC